MSVNVNLGAGVLSTGISSSDTTIVVNVGGSSIVEARSVFPTITPFYITIMPSMPTIGISNILNSEIVLVNTATGNSDGTVTLTVTRAKKNTTAKSFSAGDIVANGIYAEEAVSVGDGVATEPSPWIQTGDIVDGAVTNSKILDGAVNAGKMASAYPFLTSPRQCTPSSKIGSSNSWYIQLGKLVIVDININLSSALLNNDAVLSSLPPCAYKATPIIGNANGSCARLYMLVDETVLRSDGGTSTTGWYNGQMIYYTN